MNYSEILSDIQNILQTDYSGFIDKKDCCDYEHYAQTLLQLNQESKMASDEFIQFVNHMLLDFQDAHMGFMPVDRQNAKPSQVGFEVRRYEDKLYVTDVNFEKGIQVGDCITALDGVAITDLSLKHKKEIERVGMGAEREKWNNVLSQYKLATVLRNEAESFDLSLSLYETAPYTSNYSFKMMDNGVGFMTLSDFFDTDQINKMLHVEKANIDQCQGLIIDVRKNRGGSDSSYFKLAEYILEGDIDLKAIDDTPMQINMTERNHHLRRNSFAEALKTAEDDVTKNFLNSFIASLDKHRGQGLVEVDMNAFLPDLSINGNGLIKKVVVLTDVYCGSSGDAFVEMVKFSPKATVLGRHTAGVTDYSNLAKQCYGDQFAFMYATSRNALIDQGLGINGKGHAPHVYVPWTPAHIERDVDVEMALELF